MESSSSDEEDCRIEFWNNWLPLSNNKLAGVKSCGNAVPKTRQIFFNFSRASSVISVVENSKFGNWIPPPNFLINPLKDVRSPTSKTRQIQLQRECESLSANDNYQVTKNIGGVAGNVMKTLTCTTWSKKMSLDWGERRQLHDVTKFIDGDFIWGVVHIGIFGNIKLWVNEYGNLCCLASGKISKLGSSDIKVISLTDSELLRKMLNVSSEQWGSLCEAVKDTKAVLKFDAFEDFDPTKKTHLERLWFFMCKRRHFIQRQCMLLKFCGAVKCMRRFDITPKLLVQDIKYTTGEPVL